ncbi:MAG: helix-turn-helix domain-containing protein [Egibacteraceae bacterium]
MTTDVMTEDELFNRVRELREAGRSPKDIARNLGVRPAVVAPLVRMIAQQAAATAPEPAVVGCWVNPGWSQGLTVAGHEEWPDASPANLGANGLAGVVVARRHRPERVSVCGYLVDTYCLGVKDAIGPRTMGERDLPSFVRMFFSAFDETPLAAPMDLARHLVWGAVDYARALGFRPHPDFQRAAGHLGEWQETSAITFGENGRPLYVQGPHDDPNRVLRTLARSVGQDNFHFLVGAPASY